MVGTTLKINIDENATEKVNQVKKLAAPPGIEQPKRSALGELQNRAVVRTVKDGAQKELKDTKLQNALRNVQARIDTNRNKATVGTSNAASKAMGAAATKTGVLTTAISNPTDGQRRILLRSNSMRTSTATTTTSSGLQRNASNNLLTTHTTKLTTITDAKATEQKIAAGSKILAKSKVPAAVDGKAALRREDSNLSSKSLNKLRAALTREANSVALSKPAVTTKATTAVAATKKDVESKIPQAADKLLVKSKTHAEKNGTTNNAKSNSTATHSSKQLKAVEDIDAGDGQNLVLVSEYVNDIYAYLYSLEDEYVIRVKHLDSQEEIHAKMRAVLIDWINEVHLQFHLAAETFHMAVAIVDRYLQTVPDTKRAQLQLVGVAALFLATKYEELFPPAILDFVYITDDTYTAQQIRMMELKIFKALEYNLSRPLPIHFLRRYSKAASVEDAHHSMSKYFVELASVEYELASYKPSEVAAASLFLALHLLNSNAEAATAFNNKHWTPTLQYYSRYTPEHLRPIAKIIATIARNAPEAKLKAIYTKYESMKFHKIARRPELYGPLMDSIIKSKN